MSKTKSNQERRESMKRAVRQIIAARSDLRQAEELIGHLLSVQPTRPSNLYNAISTGIVACYARPFVDTKRASGLKGKLWDNFEDDELRQVHALALRSRNYIYAHGDKDARAVWLAPPGTITGLDGGTNPGIGYNLISPNLDERFFVALRRACDVLIGRAEVEADRLVAELYQGLELPAEPWPLAGDF